MGSGYRQDLDKYLTEDRQRELAGVAVSGIQRRLKEVSKAPGGAGEIESPAGTTGTGVGATIKKVSDALPSRREQKIGAVPTATNSPTRRKITKKPTAPDVSSGVGVAHGEGLMDVEKTATQDTRPSASMQSSYGQNLISPTGVSRASRDFMAQGASEPSATKGGGVAERLISAASRIAPTLASPSQPLGPVASRAKDNLLKQQFGPSRSLGGRDVYEMKDGERTGRILESSDWLKDGNAFSSNAWEKTVGGQPNQGYDPNAVQPAGYYNEAGTFIAGPRFKPADLESMISRATKGLKDENAIAAVTSALSNAMSGITGVVPEGTGIGPEKERGLKERIAKIAAEAEKSKAAIAASADMYRSDTPYYQEDRSTPSTPVKQQVVQIGEEPTETGGTRKIWGTPEQAVSGGDQGVSKDRVRVIQSQLRDLKGKDRDDYLDSLSPEEFNAVKGSR